MSLSGKSGAITVAIGVVVILFAMAITAVLEPAPEPESKSMSQIRVFGPVWNEANWVCTSNESYLLHVAFRGINDAQLAIAIEGAGSQRLYELNNGELESFTVGADAGREITLTRSGTISGYITLQTLDGAEASCTRQN